MSIMRLPDLSLYTPEQINDIPVLELPVEVVQHFITRAADLNGDVKRLSDFERFMKLEELGGYAVYFARKDSEMPVAKNKKIETRTIYVADMDEDELVGSGEVMYVLTPGRGERNRPYAGTTTSYYPRKGYGTRRYLAMNAVSLQIEGVPLQSTEDGTFRTEDATRRWQAFAKAGLAERQGNRFRFK